MCLCLLRDVGYVLRCGAPVAAAVAFFSRADLIVAAPFYYDREAGGAVYVYSNPPEGLTAHTPPVRLLGKPESR